METIAIKQQLLSQYDILQNRIKSLKEAAEKEVSSRTSCQATILQSSFIMHARSLLLVMQVWMLARMCQLENKIFAVGEPSYR